ncbi:hypothetical protein MKW92_016311, partial [Papaver armeniacum]
PNHIIMMHLHKTPQHTWDKSNSEDQLCITDHTQDHLGKVVSVELLETGGASVKETSDIDTPVSDEIVKVNIKFTDTRGFVTLMSYEDGWIIKVKPSSLDELEFLIDLKGYTKFCQEEDASHYDV